MGRIHNLDWILFQLCVPGFPRSKLEQIHNFLWIRSTSGKMMISFVFWHQNGRMHGIWAFWYFLSKTVRQKYSAWILGTHFIHMKVRNTFFNLHKTHRGDLFCKAYSLQVYSREFLYMHFQEFHSMKLAFSQIKELVLLITKQLIINVIISQSDW